jgi:predicted SAM-dependent methyltransferase
LNDVVEHLSDKELEDLFGKFHDVLVPKGELVIHTPNGLALTIRIRIGTYKAYLKFWGGWEGLERSAEQIYYEQLHINVKSFTQIRNFLNKQGFHARVLYDEAKIRCLQSALSSNMLVLAHRLKDCRSLH